MPACLVLLRKRESICPSDINVIFANTNSKLKHSLKNIRIVLDSEAVLLHLFVKTVTKTGKLRTHLRHTWY
jgi:hypothetical protein